MIAIRVVSRAGEPLDVPLVAHFGERGGDIGRGADCTLVLPDPERRISRKHLQVATRDGRHFIRLISSNLLVALDGVPLAPGMEYELDAGAEIRIGPFVLRAGREARAPAPSSGAPAPSDDAFALLAPPPQAGRSVFHDLLHAAPPEAWHPADAARGRTRDIDLVVGDPTGSSVLRGPDAPAEPAGAGRAGACDAQTPAERLIDALYAGLGVAAPATRSVEQMKLIGALLRASVGGTLGLLATRSIAKRELGASPTIPQVRQNNPLKFSPDTDAALAQLLGPPQRGFITPLAAVRDAFDDLRVHELAVLAGMRAALEAVLARFDPETLEKRLAGGMWDNLVPVNRKARLWERYGEQHAQIMREIEDDFDTLFGRAFLVAYEAQLARLADSSALGDGV
jgi:type VI secretion system FHA domain protein